MSMPTPDDLTLPEINRLFPDSGKAREYLEGLRWPDGPVCPHCENSQGAKIWKITASKEKKIREGLHHCGCCDRHFTVTIGTIFEDSHIPLHKWLVAWYLFATAKKGISALQMQRTLGLGSYRTAWFMMHRIRHVVTTESFSKPLTGTIEVDETYVGGKILGKGHKAGFDNKVPVVSLVERGGDKRSMVMPKVTAKNLREVVEKNVEKYSFVYTDEHGGYKNLKKGFQHASVNHREKEYARKTPSGRTVSTNTVESSFSLIKRAIYGSFHHVSRKHLPRYLAEFDHKWNTRKEKDGARMVDGLMKVAGKRMTYKPAKAALPDAVPCVSIGDGEEDHIPF